MILLPFYGGFMKKAVVYIANGSEEVETLSPVDYLRRAGVEVVLVAVADEKTVVCSHKVSINSDMTLKEYLALDELPDAVVVPGGMPGSTNIADNTGAVDFVKRMNESGKLVCAICAAPAVVLPKTGALVGKKWTCYPNMENEAPEYAGNHINNQPFVHCDNLITGRGPGAAEEFSMEIVKTLMGEEVAAKIKAGSVQR